MLKIQEDMDIHLDQRDEELCQLCSQSQADGAQLAGLSLQMQELISLVESRAKVVGKDLEEINGQFDCHRGEINCLKTREKDAKEEVKKLKGFIVGAGHEAQAFKNRLDKMEENVCWCGRTPSEVREEFVSSEDEGRMELSYASVREDKYVAPPVENVELEADYRSYRSPAIAHKRAKHLAHKPIDRINLRLVHHELYCAT